jgi:hypothetical protein
MGAKMIPEIKEQVQIDSQPRTWIVLLFAFLI